MRIFFYIIILFFFCYLDLRHFVTVYRVIIAIFTIYQHGLISNWGLFFVKVHQTVITNLQHQQSTAKPKTVHFVRIRIHKN